MAKLASLGSEPPTHVMSSANMATDFVLFPVRLCELIAITVILIANTANAQERDKQARSYSYATNGLAELQSSPVIKSWKLLLDASNLGGKELEMSELVMPAGAVVGNHHHGSVEILYILSGKLGHEVNGKLHMLAPGMVGIVRPEDTVRHIVPKDSDVRLLVIWAPGGEAKKFFGPKDRLTDRK